jgi:hypothetical protein
MTDCQKTCLGGDPEILKRRPPSPHVKATTTTHPHTRCPPPQAPLFVFCSICVYLLPAKQQYAAAAAAAACY